MIWGAMSAAGVGTLYYCKGTVNAESYQQILQDAMLPSARALFRSNDYKFMQDGARPHTARSTLNWLNQHGIHLLEWPPSSPDINPIENIWGIMKKTVRQRHPRTVPELRQVLEEEWSKIAPQMCKGLVNSLPSRMQAIIKAKGEMTKY